MLTCAPISRSTDQEDQQGAPVKWYIGASFGKLSTSGDWGNYNTTVSWFHGRCFHDYPRQMRCTAKQMDIFIYLQYFVMLHTDYEQAYFN